MKGHPPFDQYRYISLETFRRDGTGVRTPVWFAIDPGNARALFIYTNARAGKSKRIKRNGSVRIAPCDMRGTLTGDWLPGHAAQVTGPTASIGMALLNRKYWPWKQLLNLVARLRPGHERAVIAITLDQLP